MSKPASIAVLPYPISDESRQKKRLVLVLTESDGFGDFPAVTSKAHHAMAVSLAQDGMKSGSLLKPSWIRTDKVFTLNRALVAKSVGKVSEDIFRQARRAICDKIGCFLRGDPQ
jgi:mRNA interferase MazF